MRRLDVAIKQLAINIKCKNSIIQKSCRSCEINLIYFKNARKEKTQTNENLHKSSRIT